MKNPKEKKTEMAGSAGTVKARKQKNYFPST